MPNRSSIPEPDAHRNEVSAAAAALGRRGGLKGGPARAARLSADERSAIARKGAEARWSRVANKGQSNG